MVRRRGREKVEFVKISVSLSADTVEVLDGMIESGEAVNRSHAIDLCVTKAGRKINGRRRQG